MNKKLITLAVAAALAAPAAAMAEATLYGQLHVSIDYVDVDRYATWGAVPVAGGEPSVLNAAGLNGDGLPSFGPGATDTDLNGVLGALYAGTINPYELDDDGNPIVQSDPVTFDDNTTIRFYNADGSSDNIRVDGDNVFATIADSEYNRLVSRGVDPAIADVAATKAGYIAASRLASDDQLAAANQYGMLSGRGQRFKGWTLDGNARSSRIGVKGSEDLGNGLKAIYQVEFNVDIANENRDDNIANGNRGNGIAFRNSFVGLAGNFGTFLVGRHDTPLKISTGKLDLFSDTLADYNHTVGFHDVRADNAIAYISPSWSGFSFAGAIIPSGGANPLGEYNNDNDSIASAWSVAAIYNNGPFYASVAYENLTDDHWTGASDPLSETLYQGVTRQDVLTGLYGKSARDDSKWRVGLGILDWNGFTLTGIYENRSNVLGVPKEADMELWQLQGGYAFGNNMIKGMYGQADVEGCADPFGYGFWITCGRGVSLINNQDTSSWAVAFDHNFSKRTKAYALYTEVDSDQKNASWNGFSLGMIHSF